MDLVKVNEINRELSEEIDALERTVEGLEIKKMRVEEARRAEEAHKDGAKQQLLGVKLEVRRLWEQSGAQTADVGSFLAQIVMNCDADEDVVRMYVAGKKVGRCRRRCAHRMGVRMYPLVVVCGNGVCAQASNPATAVERCVSAHPRHAPARPRA